jgi:ribonuclease E
MFSPTVQLRSGGYIVINQTEALVSIDVNSGRSTREHHIEDTALKTNVEAAEEVARQLRLRDLAGLIVIDFIDMDEKRNNRSVERKLSDCLRQDRARIQVGRISHFGLLEMSRQRIRASVLESSTEPCPHCGGSGHVRSVASVALQLLRGLEEILMKGATHNLIVRTRTDVALYVLNHKRGHLRDLEESFKVSLAVIADPTVTGQQSFVIDRGEQVHTLEAAKALLAAQVAAFPPALEEVPFEDEDQFEFEAEIETDETVGLTDDQSAGEAGESETDADGRKRKRRRRRRGRTGEPREGAPARDDNDLPNTPVAAIDGDAVADLDEGNDDESEETDGEVRADQGPGGERRPRRRGRRGGRRRRGGPEDGLAGSISDELGPTSISEASFAAADLDGNVTEPAPYERLGDSVAPRLEPQPTEATVQPSEPEKPQPEPAQDSGTQEAEKARRRSTVREKVSFLVEPQPAESELPVSTSSAQSQPTAPIQPSQTAAETVPTAPEATDDTSTQPRRAGWWSRRFGNGE